MRVKQCNWIINTKRDRERDRPTDRPATKPRLCLAQLYCFRGHIRATVVTAFIVSTVVSLSSFSLSVNNHTTKKSTMKYKFGALDSARIVCGLVLLGPLALACFFTPHHLLHMIFYFTPFNLDHLLLLPLIFGHKNAVLLFVDLVGLQNVCSILFLAHSLTYSEPLARSSSNKIHYFVC